MRIVALAALTLAFILSACPSRARLPALRVSDNGRFLVTEDGRPFFWLGDTAWYLLYYPTFDELELYFANRRAKGFNVLQVIALSPRGLPNADGEQPLIDWDPLRPNEKFWRRADRIIRRANELGFYVAIVIAWRHLVVHRPVLTRSNARAWARWISSRYRDADVIWVLGGDQPVINNRDFWEEMAQGVLEGDGGRHLITYHPMGHQTSSTWFHNAPWLSFNMLQTGHARDWPTYKLVAHDWSLSPPKPVIDGEPPYEHMGNNLRPGSVKRGDVITAWDCRKALYWDVFAGAAGFTYGCNEVYRFWTPGRPGRDWGESIPWKKALDLPASFQVQHLKNLVLSRPYLSRIPDQSLIASGQQDPPGHIQAMRDADGSWAMIYIPDGHRFAVDLSKLSAARLAAWWFNPRDGRTYDGTASPSTKPFSTFTRTNAPRTFRPPTSGPENDWVLVLDDASRNFPPPGQPTY